MSRHLKAFGLVISAFVFAVAVGSGHARPLQTQSPPPQQPATLEALVNSMTMRNIGAFRTAAWVSAVDVPEVSGHDHLYTIYAGSRSGGVWKTTNGGTTWNNITDSVDIEAVGAIAISP